jgi:hypothetical protein
LLRPNHEHARSIPRLHRAECDAGFRQLEIEQIDAHENFWMSSRTPKAIRDRVTRMASYAADDPGFRDAAPG